LPTEISPVVSEMVYQFLDYIVLKFHIHNISFYFNQIDFKLFFSISISSIFHFVAARTVRNQLTPELYKTIV